MTDSTQPPSLGPTPPEGASEQPTAAHPPPPASPSAGPPEWPPVSPPAAARPEWPPAPATPPTGPGPDSPLEIGAIEEEPEIEYVTTTGRPIAIVALALAVIALVLSGLGIFPLGGIEGEKIAAGTVGSSQIAPGSVELSDLSSEALAAAQGEQGPKGARGARAKPARPAHVDPAASPGLWPR